MRKYYQAALAVTAVVSLISLLIYRHEYNKLRYVLEVFNYFGKPWSRRADNCSTSYSTFRFAEPIPSWQRLEDDLYVYSAYSINDKEIRAVALGTVNGVANVQCLVFFENESKPILGNFRFLPIASAIIPNRGVPKGGSPLKYEGYHFVCSYTSDETPTGITFVTKSNKYLDYAPIFPIKMQPRGNPTRGGTGMCVVQSSTKPTRSLDMISFISFHVLIGMDNFIVYDSGIPNGFNSRLKEIADELTPFRKFTYTVVPWNFPFTEIDAKVMREIVEVDCLYRMYNSVAYAMTLSWNEYAVLRYHHAVIDLMADFKRSKLTADRYRLGVAVFCTQQANNQQHANFTLMVLKKTKSDANIAEVHRPIYIHKPHVTLQNSRMYTREIGRDLVTVNRYKYCDNYKDGEGIENPTILRFAQDVQNSLILRRYLGL